MTTQEAYEAQREFFSRSDAAYGYRQETGDCCYRVPSRETLRCAIGCLLPDDQYERDHEREDLASIKKIYDNLGLVSLSWMRESQCLHDSCARQRHTMGEFVGMLDALALHHGLRHPKGV